MNSAAASEPPPKSLLMIAYDFPPLLAGARRPTAFALKLPRFGWRSRVLTVKPVRTWALDPEPLERLARAGVEIARAGSWDPYRIAYCLGRRRWRGAKTAAGDFSSGKREACAAQSAGARWMAWLRRCWFCPDDRAGWIGPASRLAVRLMKASSPDAIWTTSYPHSAHLVGLRLKRRFPAIPWIADFRDGWTQNDDFFLPLSARLRRRGACLERLVAREADAIAAASEPIAAHFRDLLSAELGEAEARRRVRAIPNGFDAEDLAAAEPRPWPGFCLVYAGTLFGDRTAEPLLAAAAAAIRQSGEMARDLHLGCVGACDESDFAAARRHGVAVRL